MVNNHTTVEQKHHPEYTAIKPHQSIMSVLDIDESEGRFLNNLVAN